MFRFIRHKSSRNMQVIINLYPFITTIFLRTKDLNIFFEIFNVKNQSNCRIHREKPTKIKTIINYNNLYSIFAVLSINVRRNYSILT